MKLSVCFGVLLAGLFACVAGEARGELIVNGGFESSGGFQSDYTKVVMNSSSAPEAQYGLELKPASWNVNFASFGDHTTADIHHGQMLVANGSLQSTDRVWAQSISVRAGWVYDMSFWAVSAFTDTDPTGDGLVDTPANLVFEVDGAQLFSIDLTGQAAGAWNLGSGQFTAATTGTVNLQIRNLTTVAYGNDFAIDDVSVLVAVPEPASLALFGIGSVVAVGVYSLRRRRSISS